MLYEDMLDPSVVNRFHDHFDATLPEFHRLRPRVAEAYIDVKHVNNLGRRGFSRDLVEVLLEDEGLPVPERIPDPYIAPVTPLTERIWQGVGR